jgi:hydrogenase nickel incorporation protein HypA/HybF
VHELSMMSAVADAIRDAAAREGFTRVHDVAVAVGERCNVEVAALRFCFDVAMRGTAAEHATLTIETVPGDRMVVVGLEVE